MSSRALYTLVVVAILVLGLWTYGSMKAQASECKREAPCRIV